MKKYEDLINDYISKNAPTLETRQPSKKRLIKFSEAVTRAMVERKKSDTGYGSLAESLAEAGLSGSGYEKYLRERKSSLALNEAKSEIDSAELTDATESYEKRLQDELLEKERLEAEKKEKEKLKKEEEKRLLAEEKEKLNAEKKEAERLEKEAEAREKAKKTILSFAEANKVTDSRILYNYALSLGLSEEDALSVSESAAANVMEKIRVSNIEKVREHIVLQRFTDEQAYAYAIHLGLEERDAKELADFAYKLNQNTENILGKENHGNGSGKIPIKSEITSKPHTKN